MSEFPSAYREVTRKARKEHRCCECCGFIQRGENYLYQSGIWDGEPSDYKTCSDCTALREQVITDCEYVGDDIPAIGFLIDCLEDAHLEDFKEIKARRRALAGGAA